MSRSALITILVVAVLLIGGVVWAANNSGDSNDATTQTTQETTNNETTTENATEDLTANNAASVNEVEIEDMAFLPANITVKKGTTVTWTNKDDVQHTVTPDTPVDDFEGSEMLSKDDEYSATFNTVGTYTYHCTPHPQMTGTITVTE